LEVRIRVAMEKDIPQLAQLVCDFWNEHTQLLGGKGNFTFEDGEREVKRYLGMETSGYFLVINDEGKIVGFRRWELHDDFYWTRELYVVPEMRRKGVARALIRHFEKWVLERGQNIACISCIPHNIAMIMLARSEGYDILNMIEMRKNLTDDAPKPSGEVEALGLRWKIL